MNVVSAWMSTVWPTMRKRIPCGSAAMLSAFASLTGDFSFFSSVFGSVLAGGDGAALVCSTLVSQV